MKDNQMTIQLKLDHHDCPALDVMPKINALLKEHGLEFVDDDEKNEEAYQEGTPSVYFNLEKINER